MNGLLRECREGVGGIEVDSEGIVGIGGLVGVGGPSGKMCFGDFRDEIPRGDCGAIAEHHILIDSKNIPVELPRPVKAAHHT